MPDLEFNVLRFEKVKGQAVGVVIRENSRVPMGSVHLELDGEVELSGQENKKEDSDSTCGYLEAVLSAAGGFIFQLCEHFVHSCSVTP